MNQYNSDARPIDLGAFESVVKRLQEALEAHATEPSNLFILDSVVKRFELTYELSFRSLRRFLLDYSPSSVDMEALTFQEMIRRGDELGLLANDWQQWKEYRDARNETAHSYQEDKAREIAADAVIFLAEAQHLLENLKRRIAKNAQLENN
jgi:nucleotidyltransferase substrate binding protein (TIGR01987 family)